MVKEISGQEKGNNPFFAYQNLKQNIKPEEAMLKPLMTWFSATRQNISKMNRINRMFYSVPKSVLLDYFMLNHRYTYLGKYPKAQKDDGKLDFYYDALRKLLDWTPRELKLNYADWVDAVETKEVVARKFGFDNKQRKLLGLVKIEVKKEKMKKVTETTMDRWF